MTKFSRRNLPARSRLRGWGVLVAALTLCLLSCNSQASGPSAPHSDGPLSTSSLPGMKAVYAPSESPYYVTFGSFRLCRDSPRPSGDIVVDKIVYDVDLAPLQVVPTLRLVPDEAERTGDPSSWGPIGGLLGRPGDFPSGEVSGDFTTAVDGQIVTDGCDDIRDPSRGYVELQNVMHVAKAGADIRGFTIHYHVGDQRFALEVPWRMVGCGTKLPEDLCGSPNL